MLSDFGLIPEGVRSEFVANNQDIIEGLFLRPFGHILALYEFSPMHWLLPALPVDSINQQALHREIEELRSLVNDLLDSKSEFTSRVRIVPLNRVLKHDRIKFAKGLDIVDLIPRYPDGLNMDERKMVESSLRATMNAVISQRDYIQDQSWPKHFWRHNGKLVNCQPLEREVYGAIEVNEEQTETIGRKIKLNANTAREYLRRVREEVKPDLYEPTRDEVISGLFARLTRLYCLIMENPILWARDVGGIMLRCLADSAITFVYLARKASDEEFFAFVKYGQGQQKLLMLQLQDNYPDEKSIEGIHYEQLADTLGTAMELLDIELGHWTKKDLRRLAIDGGMENLYRLVYSPTSNDLHGSWMSLKNSNLTVCVEPLHRYHRIPSFAEPPFFVNFVDVAGKLYTQCRTTAVLSLKYPKYDSELEPILLIAD